MKISTQKLYNLALKGEAGILAFTLQCGDEALPRFNPSTLCDSAMHCADGVKRKEVLYVLAKDARTKDQAQRTLLTTVPEAEYVHSKMSSKPKYPKEEWLALFDEAEAQGVRFEDLTSRYTTTAVMHNDFDFAMRLIRKHQAEDISSVAGIASRLSSYISNKLLTKWTTYCEEHDVPIVDEVYDQLLDAGATDIVFDAWHKRGVPRMENAKTYALLKFFASHKSLLDKLNDNDADETVD